MDVAQAKVSKESNWFVSHGSLQNKVVFTSKMLEQGQEQEAEAESCLLQLTQSESDGPCEVTVRFEGYFCRVQTIHVVSSARVIEIYHKTYQSSENEYICTARGRSMHSSDLNKSSKVITMNSDSSFPAENSQSTSFQYNQSSDFRSNEVQDANNSTMELKAHSLSLLSNSNEHHCQMEAHVVHDSDIKYPEGCPRNESNSSDEDSWVEVKSLCSDYVEAKQICLPRNSDSNLEGILERGNSLALKHKGQAPEDYLDGDFNASWTTQGFGSCALKLREDIIPSGDYSEAMSSFGEKDANKQPLVLPSPSKKQFYEVNVQLDFDPCTSVTIRFLSLQDKSIVEIDKFCVYGTATSALTSEISNNELNPTFERNPFSASLFAMLIPSMMQMSKGELVQRSTSLSSGTNIDSDSSKIVNNEPLPSGSSMKFSSLGDSSLEQVNVLTSTGDSVVPGCDALVKKPFESKLCSLVSTDSTCHLERTVENINYDKGSDMKTNSQFPVSFSKQIASSDDRQTLVQSEREGSTELKSSAVESSSSDSCSNDEEDGGKWNNRRLFEQMFNRMEKIEDLCLRIEDYVCKSLSNMERRLQLLESHCMQSEKLQKKMEGETVNSTVCPASDDLIMSLEETQPEVLISEEPLSVSSSVVTPKNSDLVENAAMQSNNFCPSSVEIQSRNVSFGLHASDCNIGLSGSSESLKNSGEIIDIEKISGGESLIVREKVFGLDEPNPSSSFQKNNSPKRHGIVLEEALMSSLSAFSASIACNQIGVESCAETPSSVEMHHEVCKPIHGQKGYPEGVAVERSNMDDIFKKDNLNKNTCYNAEEPQHVSQDNVGSLPFDLFQSTDDDGQCLFEENATCVTFDSTYSPSSQDDRQCGCSLNEISAPCDSAVTAKRQPPNDSSFESQKTFILNASDLSKINLQNIHTEKTKVHLGLEPELESGESFNSSRPFLIPASLNRECELNSMQLPPYDIKVEGFQDDSVSASGILVEDDGKCASNNGDARVSMSDCIFGNERVSEYDLENLVCNRIPKQVCKGVCFQDIPDAEVNRNEYNTKIVNALFFVEDEGLGEFVQPFSAGSLGHAITGSNADESLTSGYPYFFESLL